MTTIIIGAGASGLACAIRLGRLAPKSRIIVLERLSSPGKKLLATGNGRCNLSNSGADGCGEVLGFFNDLGLVTRTDSEGRIYPYSNRASDVLDMLVSECERMGVKIITDCTVFKIDGDLKVHTNLGLYTADSVVIACGGTAQKNLGSDGSGYELLKAAGHTVTPAAPGLVQLLSPSKYTRQLAGSRVKCDMSLTIDGKTKAREYGEVLFTDYGLSGIVTMNLSSAVSRNFLSDSPSKCHAVLDLVPDMSPAQLEEYAKRFNSLKGILGRQIASIIEKQAEHNPKKAAAYAKSWKFIISGTRGFDYAQITLGGAVTDEFDNYESRLVKGLYACGEILDYQFPCGGFNLNHAWLSGIKTAESIFGKQG